jgi:hypothetical protein
MLSRPLVATLRRGAERRHAAQQRRGLSVTTGTVNDALRARLAVAA